MPTVIVRGEENLDFRLGRDRLAKTTRNNSGEMEKREKRVPPKYGSCGGQEEKIRSIADFGFFCGFREGLQIMERILNELILRNRGINGQFYDVFERIMRKNGSK